MTTKEAERVACPQCGAAIGEPCRGRNGGAHLVRKVLAVRRG